jgi:division protein CdvB (Snf7/Vps24/ESCRT-III family)
MSNDPETNNKDDVDEEVKTLMTEHDLDEDTAERAQELVDEGLDENDAIELAESGL